MENTRIYKILTKTSIPMLNRFHKFMNSPYFNVNSKLIQLIDILINDIKSKKAVTSKQEIWIKTKMEGPYKDVKFRKLCNDLLERFEKFLVIEEMEKDKPLKANLLIRSLKENKFSELIDKHITKTSLEFSRNIDISSEIHLHKYNYEKNLQNLKSKFEKKEDIKTNLKKESFESMSFNLDTYYFIEKIRHASDISTWTKQYKIEFDIDITNIINQISQDQLNTSPALKIYYFIYQLLYSEEDSEKYFLLKEMAKKEIYKFPKIEQSEIFDALFSYCIRHVNKNNTPFLHEYLDLNDWGINEELTLKNGILSPTSFRNYVVIGLRVGEFDRVENYINKNIILLEHKRRDNALNFNLARLAWYKKDFQTTLSYLQKVNYDDIWYNVNSKNYLMAVYYDLEEFDVLESTIDSFLAFLRREKSINENFKKAHMDFARYLKMLLKLPIGNKSKALSLKEKINSEKNMINKTWLLEKIDELLTKK